MSRYLANLSDGIDLNAIGQQIVSGAEKVASSAASEAIGAATQAAQSGIQSVIGGGNDTAAPSVPSTPTTVSYPAPQNAEKPVSTASMAVMPLLIPAAAGIGAWVWKKSFLWAGISAATTYLAAKYLAHRKAQKGGQ